MKEFYYIAGYGFSSVYCLLLFQCALNGFRYVRYRRILFCDLVRNSRIEAVYMQILASVFYRLHPQVVNVLECCIIELYGL